MSRIGKTPVKIPQGVKMTFAGEKIFAKGPKGTLEMKVNPSILVEIKDDEVVITRIDSDRRTRGLHGLTRKLVANMVQGVSDGFSRTLEINGVGYRAEVKGSNIHLALGYSHPIIYQLPPGVTAKVDKQSVLVIEGADTQVLGEIAASIRALRPPEPYKGKGIRYAEEHVRRKAGKAAGSAE